MIIGETIKNIILEESGALALAAARLPIEAEDIVHNIAKSPNVVISGVGKAGIIAKKFVATLASYGVFATYLDPLNALHGDIGVLREDSFLIMLSHSGESKELVSVAYKAICEKALITGAEHSQLSTIVAMKITYGPLSEPGPLGLAPMSSTTSMLAIADGICGAVAELKGLKREDYAKNHPAGALGGKSVLVDEVMRDPFFLDYHDTVLKNQSWLAHQLSKAHAGIGCVLKDNEFVGVLSIADVFRSNEMSTSPTTIERGSDVGEAMKLMREKRVNQLPVLEGGKVVGIVDIQDLVGLRLDA